MCCPNRICDTASISGSRTQPNDSCRPCRDSMVIFVRLTQGSARGPSLHPGPNPLFSQAIYCSGGIIRLGCVALCRPPRRTCQYDCGGLSTTSSQLSARRAGCHMSSLRDSGRQDICVADGVPLGGTLCAKPRVERSETLGKTIDNRFESRPRDDMNLSALLLKHLSHYTRDRHHGANWQCK